MRRPMNEVPEVSVSANQKKKVSAKGQMLTKGESPLGAGEKKNTHGQMCEGVGEEIEDLLTQQGIQK